MRRLRYIFYKVGLNLTHLQTKQNVRNLRLVWRNTNTLLKLNKPYVLVIQNRNSNKVKIVSNIKLQLLYVTTGMIFKYAWSKR